MDLNKLRYFYVAAKHQNVTHAAQELYISQPALSKAIRQLEQDLGIKLFAKQKRGIRLTPFGNHLVDRLDMVFPILDRLPGELAQIKSQTDHTVKLNVLVASIITADAIAAYKTANPHVNFQVSLNQPDCHISINTGPDAFLKEWSEENQIVEDIFLAVPKSSPYAHRDAISLKDVKDEWFISISHARPFRQIGDDLCLQAGFKPNVTFESDFPNAVRNLISAGVGIGFWPAFSFGEISADIKLLPILSPRCQRTLVLRLGKNPPPAATHFYRYLLRYLLEKAQRAENT